MTYNELKQLAAKRKQFTEAMEKNLENGQTIKQAAKQAALVSETAKRLKTAGVNTKAAGM